MKALRDKFVAAGLSMATASGHGHVFQAFAILREMCKLSVVIRKRKSFAKSQVNFSFIINRQGRCKNSLLKVCWSRRADVTQRP